MNAHTLMNIHRNLVFNENTEVRKDRESSKLKKFEQAAQIIMIYSYYIFTSPREAKKLFTEQIFPYSDSIV
jgi:hypothetical protein